LIRGFYLKHQHGIGLEKKSGRAPGNALKGYFFLSFTK